MVDHVAVLTPTRRRNGPGARLRVAAILLLVPVAGSAVTPASPKLNGASRVSLTRGLAAAGISEVGGSAVLVALLAVLGTAPAGRQYRYREPYPQLPDVDAEAAVAGPGCAAVVLDARPKAGPSRTVSITGTYCLLDRASLEWGARALSVTAR